MIYSKNCNSSSCTDKIWIGRSIKAYEAKTNFHEHINVPRSCNCSLIKKYLETGLGWPVWYRKIGLQPVLEEKYFWGVQFLNRPMKLTYTIKTIDYYLNEHNWVGPTFKTI